MTPMIYSDSVYGELTIESSILLDLMETKAMQRLHGVLQHGVTALIGITQPTTRFEHSIGVMELVRRLGGGIEEQIAALLHDVSHTAFSHVIDYVFQSHDSQGYHEEMKEPYIANSDIPAVLERFGYDWHILLHEEEFYLLERPAPELCADRLDYFLRDSLSLKLASITEVQDALKHLTVYDGRIVVDSMDVARWIGNTFIAADQASWANFREVGLYELAAIAIRRALKIGVLTEADIWTTDMQAWTRMHSSDDSELQSALRVVSPATTFLWDEATPTFRVSTKLRTLDPQILLEGQAQSLSKLDEVFTQHQASYLQGKRGKWPMRVIPPGETSIVRNELHLVNRVS